MRKKTQHNPALKRFVTYLVHFYIIKKSKSNKDPYSNMDKLK